MSKEDPLKAGRSMIEQMMAEAKKDGSKVPFEDKLKLLDRWIKFQDLEHRRKAGSMGKGFDDMGGDDDGSGDEL